MAVEGVGPLTATALIAAVGNERQFRSGRELSAWLGLAPRQHSSGGCSVFLGGFRVRRVQYR
jgi:transposase